MSPATSPSEPTIPRTVRSCRTLLLVRRDVVQPDESGVPGRESCCPIGAEQLAVAPWSHLESTINEPTAEYLRIRDCAPLTPDRLLAFEATLPDPSRFRSPRVVWAGRRMGSAAPEASPCASFKFLLSWLCATPHPCGTSDQEREYWATPPAPPQGGCLRSSK